MARIRSIHPGFFTDQDLVATSMAARILFLGLGVEADDQGIFEWKPLQIKMKIFPADNLDVTDLLSELEAANAIQKYEINGRQLGAIRNFRRFQRPKTPNSIHAITHEIGIYVGLTTANSEKPEDEPEPFPPNGEKSPQMEDGGDKMEDGGCKDSPIPPKPDLSEFVAAWNLMAKPLKIPIIQRLSDKRQAQLRARMPEIGGFDGWLVMLDKIRNSRFLRGDSGSWRVFFDWVLNPTNLTKIMEGNYDDRPNGNGSKPHIRTKTELILETLNRGNGEGDPDVWDQSGPGNTANPPD